MDDFEYFLASLPDYQRDTTSFDVKRYWELNGKPKDFKEALSKGMYVLMDDGYHANSVAYNPDTDEYEILKTISHPTRILEQITYFSNPDFKRHYIQSGDKYVRIPTNYIELKRGGRVPKLSRIHIKPENKGKFTKLKERTGHSATWFKEHGTPAQKKMAIFALNAKKWKH